MSERARRRPRRTHASGKRGIVLLIVTVTAGGILAAGPAKAGGGGFCKRPVRTARGTTVEMKNFCFTPTVLHVGVGQTVKWINRDDTPHVLAGTNGMWSTEGELAKHQLVKYRFREPGIYPYTCYYHVGMNGAVVVGKFNGARAASAPPEGGDIVSSPPSPAPASSEGSEARPDRAVPQMVRASSPAWRAGTFAGFGLFFLSAVAFVMQRRAIRRTDAGRDRG